MPIKIKSSGGGSITLDVPSTAVDTTLFLPTSNGAAIYSNTNTSFSGNVAVSGANSYISINGNNVTPFAMRNRLINGDMRIWQRGTTTANTTSYTADRWFVNRNGGGSGVTVSRSGDATNYYLKVQRNANDTQTGALDVRQVIETLNCADLAGKSVTLSFVGYVGANYSVGSNSVVLELRSSTATDDNVNVVGSWSSVGSSTLSLTTTPTRYSATFTVPANALTLMLRIYGGNYSGTAGADDSLYITQVQLEEGSILTPFERRSFTTELQLCQRYYEKSYNLGTAIGTATGIDAGAMAGTGVDVNDITCSVVFAARKRAAPTITLYNSNNGVSGGVYDWTNGVNYTGASVGSGGEHGFSHLSISGAVTTPHGYSFHYTASIEL